MSAIADAKDLAATFQSIITPVGVAVAGIWAYRKYVIEEARYSHIQSGAEIVIIGRQNDDWIVELKASLENKGKAQHRIDSFNFDLFGLFRGDALTSSDRWGGQAYFPHELAKGSMIPVDFKYFVIGPGVKAIYSYVARVPKETTFLQFHAWFDYADKRKLSHAMECTIEVRETAPKCLVTPQLNEGGTKG